MKFTLNPAGVDNLVESAGVLRALNDGARDVKAAVERHAPVETGDFEDSIRVHPPTITATGVEQTVDSDDFAAHLIEFGSVNNPPYAPFRKAASSLGLRLRGGGDRK